MLAAIFLAHLTLRPVEFVVTGTHEAGWFGITVSIALGGGGTIRKRYWYHPRSASFLLHFTQRVIGIAVRSANWSGSVVVLGAFFRTLEYGCLEFCAGTYMGQGYATPAELN